MIRLAWGSPIRARKRATTPRAIRYDYVDFSTLDRRRAACENEIRINRRTAPGMYLGVVPIHRDNGAVGWKASGEIIEWAVEMARFEPGMRCSFMHNMPVFPAYTNFLTLPPFDGHRPRRALHPRLRGP